MAVQAGECASWTSLPHSAGRRSTTGSQFAELVEAVCEQIIPAAAVALEEYCKVPQGSGTIEEAESPVRVVLHGGALLPWLTVPLERAGERPHGAISVPALPGSEACRAESGLLTSAPRCADGVSKAEEQPVVVPLVESTSGTVHQAPTQWGSSSVELGSLGLAVADGGMVNTEAKAGSAPQQEQLRSDSPVAQQLRVLFVQAVEQALRVNRQEMPTAAHLRLEIPSGGWLTLTVAVHGEQVHIWARSSSSELGRQLIGSADELQQLLNVRQLQLTEITVRTPEPFSSTAQHAGQQQSQGEAYREREQFVRSFRWHRIRTSSEEPWQNLLGYYRR